MKSQKKEITLWKDQAKFLKSQAREVLLECGIGYGKTFIGALFIVNKVPSYPDMRFMVVSRDYPQLRKAVIPEMMNALKLLEYYEGTHYTFNKSTSQFTFWNNVIIDCVSAKNYNSAFRGPNVAIIWADECDYYDKEAWLTMLGRLRTGPELLRATSSPKGFNHIYEHFYNGDTSDKLVLNAPSWKNRRLSKAYLKSLESAYSPRLFEQEVLARRLNLKLGQVYSEFDRNIHVQECKHLIQDHHQLYFFTDYNISHYCGVYMFEDKGVVYAIGEEHLEFKTTEIMAQTVKAKYPKRPIIVIGDSAGNNKRGTDVSLTNYQVFRKYGLGTKRYRNPPVESRIICAQSNLHHKRLVIDPSCPTLIKDLELLAWKEDGSGIDKKDITLSHASDAYTYGVYYFLPLRAKQTPLPEISRF